MARSLARNGLETAVLPDLASNVAEVWPGLARNFARYAAKNLARSTYQEILLGLVISLIPYYYKRENSRRFFYIR